MKRTLALAALLLTAPLAFAQQPAVAPQAPPPAAAPAPAAAPVTAPAPAAAAEPEKQVPHVEPLGFTWWNDIPEMIRRGNDAMKSGDAATSSEYYRNAQLQNPDEPVASFNHGLARAKEGDMPGAMEQLRNAIDLAPKNRDLRNRAYYNMGVGQFEMAKAAEKAQKRDDAIHSALDAIEALDSAVREGGPEAGAAEDLKKQAQHFLQKFAVPPPQQQQGGKGKNDKSNEDKQQQQSKDQQQQQQQQQDKQQQQDQNQQQQQDSQQKQDQQDQQSQQDQKDQQQKDGQQQQQDEKEKKDQADGKKQEEKKDEEKKQGDEKKDKQDGGEGQQQQASADKMSEEQAKQLLNLVDDDKSVRLRKGGRARQQDEKDW